MAKAKRVFQIAKQLGVSSKDVLEKCRAEGVDLNNHMSTVSVGLEMTIREWFGDEDGSASHTAVETARKVDLTKVKKAKARKRAKPAEAPAEQASTTTAEVDPAPAEPTVETPTEQPAPSDQPTEQADPAQPRRAAKKKAAAKKKPKPEPAAEPAVADTPVVESPPAEPDRAPAQAAEQAEQPEQAEPDRVAAETESTEPSDDQAADAESEQSTDAGAVPNVPQRPEEVKPAGPQLEKPKAARLKGPKVVRVEQPDVLRRPRSRRTEAAPPAPGEPELIRSRGPARGRGAGGRTEDEFSRSPRRKRGGQRGRSGAAETTLRGKFSEQDLIEREERLSRAGGFLRQRRREMRRRGEASSTAPTPAKVGGKVEISEPFTIKDLSAATGIKASQIVAFLFNKGVMATINQTIDVDAATEVCLEYEIELEVKEAQSAEEVVQERLEARDEIDIRRRPPVVTILGHVDHGKTSLLDRIRQAHVVDGEAGGITQHIGAYRATITSGEGQDKTVVFLDTPGHEAFTSMRSRGANLTDIVVLVIAADDGVMPQTVESVNHAKAAGVPIVVALNKVDLPQATNENIQKIFGQLAEHELNPVEWGGQVEVVRTSAETGDGISDLIEILDYQAELLELTAEYGGQAFGQVIEAELSEGRGPVARILVQGGQLHIGDFIVMGRAFGRVRDMIDDRGNNIEIAGPATPLEISGIDEVPDAGDKAYATETLKQAEEIAEQRRDRDRKRELAAKSKVTLDNLFDQIQTADVKELRIVVKADVQGSVEVLRKTLEEVGQENEEVSVRVLHAAVGGITESDVLLAEASNAVVIGFQVIASQRARAEAEHRGVDIRLYRVIYDVMDDVRNALEGMLSPEQREEVLGHAEVRDVFRVSKVGAVAGCYVTDGVVRRNALIRVTRDDVVIEHDRTLESLKRFKEDAREVRSGMECGMSIEGYDDIRPGDVLECYVQTEVRATL